MKRKPKIVTVIAGFENADVLPFTARVPMKISELVVFVDGIRPIVRRKEPEIHWKEVRKKPCSRDKTAQVACDLGMVYLIVAQIFALYKSMNMNITPDNPCPTGLVNRGVRGVIIHEK